MFDKFKTFEKIFDACHPETKITDENNNLFGQTETCNYWIRLIPEQDNYNMYVKVYIK